MKISEILSEAPIPDDWDVDIFDQSVSFSKRVKYARERGKFLGAGSSRVAVEIPYKGRDTVLKIAKNAKGYAQNEVEIGFLYDHLLRDIVIPVIDYDEESSEPTWIHVEKADKFKVAALRKATTSYVDDAHTRKRSINTLSELILFAQYMTGAIYDKTAVDDQDKEDYQYMFEENEFLSDFVHLVGNYDISVGDLKVAANWGIYKGSLRIIDIGLTKQVFISHYSK